ncbi:hypothetical protein [Aliterella atlantica]|uniref:hypothetical protein n=1 Tax=Aliterella atlantica TaxID=1827278 RepID=UPI00069847D1|nr:hypothetical protein [Aliterella atlantica]
MGAIKKLLTGILSFFVGLLGGKKAQSGQLNPASSPAKTKKRSGYFMELDESEENGSLLNKINPTAVVKQVQETANTVAKQAKETVSTATKQVQETANAATGQAKETVNTASNKVQETANTATNKVQETANTATGKVKETAKSAEPVAAKSAKETNRTAEPAAQPKSKVELVQTAEGLKAEPIKNEPSVVASSNGQKTDTTFAPKYLNPATASSKRRRPGANMSSFLDMANQVKPAKS